MGSVRTTCSLCLNALDVSEKPDRAWADGREVSSRAA
jgi:hypothetical protein